MEKVNTSISTACNSSCSIHWTQHEICKQFHRCADLDEQPNRTCSSPVYSRLTCLLTSCNNQQVVAVFDQSRQHSVRKWRNKRQDFFFFFYKIWFINYDTDHIRPCCIHHSHWDKLPYSANNNSFFLFSFDGSFQYTVLHFFDDFFLPPPHYFVIFFSSSLHSERVVEPSSSTGEEIMHYTGPLSQPFTKKLLTKKMHCSSF